MPRKPSDGADRQSINVRTRVDIKQALEAIAAQNGRSLAQEVERRLEKSLENSGSAVAKDLLYGIFSEEQRLYLSRNLDAARFVEYITEAHMRITRLAREGGLSEIDTRAALREASSFLAAWFMWDGEVVSRAEIPKGGRLIDQPPAIIGRKVAEDFMLYLNAMHDGGALQDALDERIRNVYSGDGRTQISQETE